MWISTQNPHDVRGFLARALGIAEHQVRVIKNDVGGGFGQKIFMLPDELAVVLAGRAPRPAGQVDRGPPREPHRPTSTPAQDRMTVQMAFDDDGRILAWRSTTLEDVGAFAAAGHSAIGFVADALRRALPDPEGPVHVDDRVHEHVRPVLVPRPVDDRDAALART